MNASKDKKLTTEPSVESIDNTLFAGSLAILMGALIALELSPLLVVLRPLAPPLSASTIILATASTIILAATIDALTTVLLSYNISRTRWTTDFIQTVSKTFDTSMHHTNATFKKLKFDF